MQHSNMTNNDLNFTNGSNSPMPAPRPGKGGSWKVFLLALIAILCLSGMCYWVTRTEEDKEELRNQAAETVNGITDGTPLAGIGEVLRKSPPPPPPAVTIPPTAPGTLAGRNVTGTIASPIEQQYNFENAQTQNTMNPSVNSDILHQDAQIQSDPAIKADKEVTPQFIEELAQWLASKYRPSSNNLDANAQNINHFGGVNLATQTKGGRAALLRYAFQPSMLNGLYGIYINNFMDDLTQAANKRGFTPLQNKQFHLALAGKAVLWATVLEGVLEVKDLKSRLTKIDDLAQNVVNANMNLTTAVFELDELRENKGSSSQLDAAQLRVDGLAAKYRRATDEHLNAQRLLISEIRKNSGQSLNDDTLLFIAAWTERRLAENQDGRESLKVCAKLLRDLGRRCAQFGTGS